MHLENLLIKTVSQQWKKLPVELPASLVNTLAALNAANVSHVQQPELPDEMPENPEDLVRSLTDQLLRQEAEKKARSLLGELAKKRLRTEMNNSVEPIIDQLQKPFAKAAKTYTAAVEQLPADLTAEELVQASGNVSKAYQEAKEAAVFLTQVERFITHVLQYLRHGVPHSTPVKLVDARTQEDLVALQRKSGNRLISDLNETLFNAVKAGLPIVLSSIEEIQDRYDWIKDEPLRKREEAEQMAKRGRGADTRARLEAFRKMYGIDAINLG